MKIYLRQDRMLYFPARATVGGVAGAGLQAVGKRVKISLVNA